MRRTFEDKNVRLVAGLSLLTVVLLGFIGWLLFVQTSTTVKIRLGSGEFQAQIAATDEERARGLGGVMSLADNEAMLFIYDGDQEGRIWMKDMKIPIDAVWLDVNKRVVHMEESLQPSSYHEGKTYGPTVPVRYIVELPASAVRKNAITQGSQAIFDETKGERE